MSFNALKTPVSPLGRAFEEAAKTSRLPGVLPIEVGALQTLLAAQQNTHLTALHQVVQAAHQEVQTVRDQALQEVQAAREEARQEMQAARDEAQAYIIRMLEQATLARQRMFGASSEQMSAQSRLFDEAEVLALASTEAQDTAPIAPEDTQDTAPAADAAQAATKPARGKRAPLAAGLPRVDVLHDGPRPIAPALVARPWC